MYPAGNYEALRITLGEGKGQNWWCVLFPPLCFVDSDAIVKKTNVAETAAASDRAKDGEGGSKQQQSKAQTEKDGKPAKAASSKSSSNADKANTLGEKQTAVSAQSAAPQPEIHFFLWDLLKKLGSMFA